MIAKLTIEGTSILPDFKMKGKMNQTASYGKILWLSHYFSKTLKGGNSSYKSQAFNS